MRNIHAHMYVRTYQYPHTTRTRRYMYPHSHVHIRTNIHARYDKNNGTNDMHDYCKQLLVFGFTHAKHCKDIPTVAVTSKYSTYNVLYNKQNQLGGRGHSLLLE